MNTIPRVVEQLVTDKPYLVEMLQDDLINISALARQLQPKVEEVLQKPVKCSAIIMALKRMPLGPMGVNPRRLKDVLGKFGDITVRSNLVDYTYRNSYNIIHKQTLLLNKLADRPDVFYALTRGLYETTLVLSNDLTNEVEEIFAEENLVAQTSSLAALTVKLPFENNEMPGLYYSIFKKIFWSGINILEVFSTTNEFTILVEEKDIEQAFSLVKNIKE